jgi:hypothetical protein
VIEESASSVEPAVTATITISASRAADAASAAVRTLAPARDRALAEMSKAVIFMGVPNKAPALLKSRAKIEPTSPKPMIPKDGTRASHNARPKFEICRPQQQASSRFFVHTATGRQVSIYLMRS